MECSAEIKDGFERVVHDRQEDSIERRIQGHCELVRTRSSVQLANQ